MQLLFAILISGSAMSQPYIYSASLGDGDMGHSSTAAAGTLNTGYDLLAGLGESVNGLAIGCNMTASVWDGSNSTHGGLYLAKGQMGKTRFWNDLLGYDLKDPDVVVGYYNGALQAAVVGISAADGLVHLIIATPDCDEELKFTIRKVSDCAFGRVSNPTSSTSTSYGSFSSTGRQCSNPNIDANSAGQIAIVWQESISYNFIFHVSAPVPPYVLSTPGFDLPLTSTESNIFALHGYIDGTRSAGSGSICGGDLAKGCDRIVNLGTGEESVSNEIYYNITAQSGEYNTPGSEHNSYNPDVAIGQGTNPYVSYSYMNNGQLNVYQHHWGVCPVLASDILNAGFTGFVGNKPRIAAKPSSTNQTDFVVVGGAKFSTDCPDYTPSGFISAVWIDGTHNQLSAVILNDNLDLTGTWNTDPVVSYYTDHDGDYYQTIDNDLANSWIVAWTVTNATVTGAHQEGDADDIIARHYKVDGTPLYPSNYYSFINYYNGHGLGMPGNQRIPSIASRYGAGATGYAFNDENITEAITKVAFENHPGEDHIKNDGRGECTDCRGEIGGGDNKSLRPNPIQIFPNPGHGSFAIKLAANDKSDKAIIMVTDAKGNILLKQEWNKSQGEPKIVLKDLPAGLYNVQFTTPDGQLRHALYNNQK